MLKRLESRVVVDATFFGVHESTQTYGLGGLATSVVVLVAGSAYELGPSQDRPLGQRMQSGPRAGRLISPVRTTKSTNHDEGIKSAFGRVGVWRPFWHNYNNNKAVAFMSL